MANLLQYLWDPIVWKQRRQRKLQALGKTECGLRVVAGSQDGLSDKWTFGIAILHPGHLEFLPARFRSPGQKPLRITVSAATRAHERTSKGREAVMSLHPSFRIVTIRTPDAELEWALSPEQRDWALARVNADSTG